MNNGTTGQVVASAAEFYEEFFVPALFQEWTDRVAEAANIRDGDEVLDVACGTGALTRTVAKRVGASGSVIGLDINEDMLAVAQTKSTVNAPVIEWQQGAAERLPFDDDSFDAVVSQFGLMFFIHPRDAIQEMTRVLRPGGHLAIAVWDVLENSPGYAAEVALIQHLFGAQAADAMRAPFTLGDKQKLGEIFTEAGLPHVTIETRDGTAQFPSVEAWVNTDVKGWTLSEMINDAQHQQLLDRAKSELASFANAEGAVSFRSPAHIVSVTL
ncbi:MAG: class I SAM-dependent methyltransferase [Chloroflexota bacterium]